jgi:phosphoribosylformylglycinamidine synthase subunit PurS
LNPKFLPLLMKYIAEVNVMPLKEILDPQGKAVGLGLKNLGLNTVSDVRIGKHIMLALEADNEQDAHAACDKACQQLLANLIMEDYSFTLRAA